MRRNAFRPLWVILALLLLVEAWLWDHLEPIVARVVNLIPWGRVKVAVARWVEDLPPYAALFVFVVPLLVVLPVKFLEVYFIATANWFGADRNTCAGKAAWAWRDCFCIRRDARQAVADTVVPADVRLGHMGARLGLYANRAYPCAHSETRLDVSARASEANISTAYASTSILQSPCLM